MWTDKNKSNFVDYLSGGKTEDLGRHDKLYHSGGFDPLTMRCSLRDRLSGSDLADDVSAGAAQQKGWRAKTVWEAFNIKASRIIKFLSDDNLVLNWKNQFPLDKDSARIWMLSAIRGEYVNESTGEKISISRRSIKKVSSHDIYDVVHLKSLILIPELVQKARFICEQEKVREDKKFDRYRYFCSGVEIDGVSYTAKVVVGIKNGISYYDHNLTKVEKGRLVEALNEVDDPVAHQSSQMKIYDTKIIEVLQEDGLRRRSVVDATAGIGVLAKGMDTERLKDFLRTDAADESIAEHDKRFHGGFFDATTQHCAKREKMMGRDDQTSRFPSTSRIDKISSHGKEDNSHKKIARTTGALGRIFGRTFSRPTLAIVGNRILAKNGDAERGVTLEKGGQISPASVKDIFNAVNHDETNERLFNAVFPVAEKLGVEFFLTKGSRGSLSQGHQESGRVALYTDKLTSRLATDLDASRAILHELIHGVTAYAIHIASGEVEIEGIKPSPELVRATKELEDLYKDNKMWIGGEYGRKDVHEFIAELANPGFRQRLKKRGVLRRICESSADIIRKVVGAKEKERGKDYERLESLLEDFLKHSDTSAFEAYQFDDE